MEISIRRTQDDSLSPSDIDLMDQTRMHQIEEVNYCRGLLYGLADPQYNVQTPKKTSDMNGSV